MAKIKYKTDGDICLTPCPFDFLQDIMVESVYCQVGCDHRIGIVNSRKEKYILCDNNNIRYS